MKNKKNKLLTELLNDLNGITEGETENNAHKAVGIFIEQSDISSLDMTNTILSNCLPEEIFDYWEDARVHKYMDQLANSYKEVYLKSDNSGTAVCVVNTLTFFLVLYDVSHDLHKGDITAILAEIFDD